MAVAANSKLGYWAKKLECPVDNDGTYENTYWCNRDLIPTPPDRQTWNWQGFAGYWVIAGINTTAWTVGSILLQLGMSVGQAMGIVIAGCTMIGLLAVAGGWMGSHHHVGFTVTCRSSWGMLGAFWPVLNRVMTGCVFMGIQMYWGGLATRILLNAIIGRPFIFMRNTLPESANVTTPDLICFFIFAAALVPLLMLPPEKLQLPFRIAFVMITAVLVGMLVWSLAAAGGAGSLLTTGTTQGGSVLSWNMIYGLSSFIGSWSGGVLGQSARANIPSDWTRYSARPHSALFGQAFAAPLTVCLTALFGILITSASAQLYGQIFWNPFLLILYIQSTPTASARAGTFFAGLGLLASQLALCIVLNSVSAGMDLTTLFPKYINIRRGSFAIFLVGIAIVPWNYVNEASTFITILSGWSVFLSPMTGILIADYYFVRRRQLHLTDLYVGNCTSAYWYTFGFNWRAVAAWAMGLWPLLPGFVRSVQMRGTYAGWDGLYDINYFFGFGVSFLVHLTLHTVFPAPGQTGSSPFLFGEKGVLAGDADSSDGNDSYSGGGVSENKS